jgi:hypothetical protein
MPQRDRMLCKVSVGGVWKTLPRPSFFVTRSCWTSSLGKDHVDISRTRKKFHSGARFSIGFDTQVSFNRLITQQIKDSTENLIGTRSAKG